jgi:hypothetical protein
MALTLPSKRPQTWRRLQEYGRRKNGACRGRGVAILGFGWDDERRPCDTNLSRMTGTTTTRTRSWPARPHPAGAVGPPASSAKVSPRRGVEPNEEAFVRRHYPRRALALLRDDSQSMAPHLVSHRIAVGPLASERGISGVCQADRTIVLCRGEPSQSMARRELLRCGKDRARKRI